MAKRLQLPRLREADFLSLYKTKEKNLSFVFVTSSLL